MDNQHKLIKGYQDLTQAEIDQINRWKEVEADLHRLLDANPVRSGAQARWNAMARTNLEQGIMWAIKVVANPKGGLGNPDGEPVPELDVDPEASSELDQRLAELDEAELAVEEKMERERARTPGLIEGHAGGGYSGALETKLAAQQAARAQGGLAGTSRIEGQRFITPKLTEDQIAADRTEHGFDPNATPAQKALATERAQDARQQAERQQRAARGEPEPAPVKSMAPRRSEPNATFGSGGARFVPTPDNPGDDPLSAAGRPPLGETSPITSDRQTELPAKRDRDPLDEMPF